MKATLCSFLLLATVGFNANGRPIHGLSFRELYTRADFIAVAAPVSTLDTGEQIILPGIGVDIAVIGLSSEFKIDIVLKGDEKLKKLVLHHYRLANPKANFINGPELASFDPQETNRFLLFLVREVDGRFAPASGQVDPIVSSVLKLNGAGWDKMELTDFKRWLDANKWQNEGPMGSSQISPVIPADAGEGNIFEAVLNGKLEMTRMLIEANPSLVSSRYEEGETPLHRAAKYGQVQEAKLLLASKADVNAKDTFGALTPLLAAVWAKQEEIVKLLLASNADVNFSPANSGRNSLWVAADTDQKDMVALLLSKKANINAKNSDGRTALYSAAALGNLDVMRVLLTNKADMEAKDNKGETPLLVAARQRRLDAVKFLLDSGANPNAKENDGETPLSLAQKNGQPDVVNLLKSRMNSVY